MKVQIFENFLSLPSSKSLITFYHILVFFFFVNGKPFKPTKSSCHEMPNPSKDLGTIENEETFISNTTNDIYFCRKLFTENSPVEIVRQKSSVTRGTPDFIEATDCSTYYYVLKFDSSCDFMTQNEKCVKQCDRNQICPQETKLCSTRIELFQINTEMDFDPRHYYLFNFNNTLRKHCDDNHLENELPGFEKTC